MRSSAAAAVTLLTLSFGLAAGCGQSRTFTIYSKPADAKLVINGVERGPGPITQRFDFGSGGAARVTATKEGFRTTTKRLTANTRHDTVVIELPALGPKVVVSIEPAAMVRVNGQLVRPTPIREHEFTLEPDKTYTITAEQTGFTREVRTITSKDRKGYYSIVLNPEGRGEDGGLVQVPRPPPERVAQSQPIAPAPATRPAPVVVRSDPPVVPQPRPQPPAPPQSLRRDIVIRAEPAAAGAEIYIGGEKWGDREVRLTNHEFKRDPSGKPVPQPISAVAPDFEGGKATMRWEDNKPTYVISLGRRRKEVRIATDPPGATVTLNGKVLQKDRNGVSFDTVYFPPEDPPQRPTTVSGTVTAADPSAFEPAPLAIRWDDGRKDYSVKLEPSRYVKVAMVQAVPSWDASRGGWRVLGNRVETLAARDVSEGMGRPSPQPLTELPAGTMLDSVVASPDGTLVLYTELIAGQPGTQGTSALRAQMRLLNSDGSFGAALPSDGRHFDAMPSFTSDGGRIVFTSDRQAGGLDVWTITLGEEGGVVDQLARGGEKAALWPMIDASPGQRLFYEAFLRSTDGPNQPRSEVRMVELESKTKRGLSPGTRPRASPRADAVVFTRADPATGKRDLYLVSEKAGAAFAGAPVNLTKTPDVDECDPVFSRTGGKIAYAADAAAPEGNRRQYDLYVLTVSDPGQPVRVTQNASLDDSPAWDPAGKYLYFRSNRGGRWGVWKVAVP